MPMPTTPRIRHASLLSKQHGGIHEDNEENGGKNISLLILNWLTIIIVEGWSSFSALLLCFECVCMRMYECFVYVCKSNFLLWLLPHPSVLMTSLLNYQRCKNVIRPFNSCLGFPHVLMLAPQSSSYVYNSHSHQRRLVTSCLHTISVIKSSTITQNTSTTLFPNTTALSQLSRRQLFGFNGNAERVSLKDTRIVP